MAGPRSPHGRVCRQLRKVSVDTAGRAGAPATVRVVPPPPSVTWQPLRSAVMTVVAGRHDHLRGQRSALASSAPRPDLHVVVSMGDPGIAQVLDDDTGLATRLIEVGVPEGGLPLAQSRNVGAAAAIKDGAQLLIALDVDCLPDQGMLARYSAAVASPEGRRGLLAGPVTYLPPAPREGWTAKSLSEHRAPHRARPVPAAGTLEVGDHRLFWSLSFALTAETWDRVGGFCPDYVGYGGEDTDFAMTAKKAGVPLLWVGGADAFHQHHAVSSPPVEHLTDILRNGAIFNARWGHWPMEGWLAEFERLHLIARKGQDWKRVQPLRLASIPANHPYVDAVRPPSATVAEGDRVAGWDPDPLLIPARLRAGAARFDVLHLHFGYDHLTAAAMEVWLAEVRDRRVPLVVTVHDLRNPHHQTRELHDEHLRLLMSQADEVLTLTEGAAAEIARRFGRLATVVPHPSLLDPSSPMARSTTEEGLVAIHLKSLRRNAAAEPRRVVAAALEGTNAAGGRLRVDVHSEVLTRPELEHIRTCAARGELELAVHERFTDDELAVYLSRAQVCVLPYQYGTHSGWLELCRDLGTRVVAPSCGYFGGEDGQWNDVVSFGYDETAGLAANSLSAAVKASLEAPLLQPADRSWRAAQLQEVQAMHSEIYERVRPR
jgi:hypothetical protein